MNALDLSKQLNIKFTHELKVKKENFYYYYFNKRKLSNYNFTKAFFNQLDTILASNQIKCYSRGPYSELIEYSQKEKLTVDLVTWKSFNRGSSEKNIKENLWKYVTICEHENNGFTWLDELQNLCSIKCEDKLIITYGRCPEMKCETPNNEYDDNLSKSYHTPSNKGVNLLDHANIIVKETLSTSERKIIELSSSDEKIVELLPNIVVMFGAEVAELNDKDIESFSYLYDRYQYNYIQEKFELIQEDK
ncbi:MAG: hypothetical protein RR565_02995 [Erysipelothrix sp.]